MLSLLDAAIVSVKVHLMYLPYYLIKSLHFIGPSFWQRVEQCEYNAALLFQPLSLLKQTLTGEYVNTSVLTLDQPRRSFRGDVWTGSEGSGLIAFFLVFSKSSRV